VWVLTDVLIALLLQEELLELEEERALHAAYKAAAAQVSSDMDVPAFLVATEQLIAPLDAFFDKVFVMCEDEVRRGAARCER
jgi:glycyl-tRNA synthetase